MRRTGVMHLSLISTQRWQIGRPKMPKGLFYRHELLPEMLYKAVMHLSLMRIQRRENCWPNARVSRIANVFFISTELSHHSQQLCVCVCVCVCVRCVCVCVFVCVCCHAKTPRLGSFHRQLHVFAAPRCLGSSYNIFL